MSESRQINFTVNLDTSQVPKQSEQTTKQIRSELEKQKANIERILKEISASGGRLKVPIEDFKAAIGATEKALDSMGTKNEQTVERLQRKYGELEVSMKKAWNEGNPTSAQATQRTMIAIDRECRERQALGNEIRQQLTALEQLDAEATRNVTVTQQQQQAEQGLTGQSKSLREEIRGIAIALAEMEANGQRGSEAYNRLRARGAQLTDAMGDARTQMRLLAHDNAGLQGVMDGLSGVSGAFTAATGAITLFGIENENLQKSMVRLQSVMSITMGLQQVLNTLNKDSAFRLGVVSRLQEWWTACKAKAAAAATTETATLTTNTTAQIAQTTAVQAGTTANVAHAASWKAVGVAIKSVPVFGWIIAGITALVSVIALLANRNKEAKKEIDELIDAEKRAAAETERLKNAQNQMTSSLESGRAELALDIAKLKNFKGTQEQEKKVVDQLNRKYGETMGYFSKVSDWYNALIQNSEDYCRQMIIEARTRMIANQIAQKEQENYNIVYDPQTGEKKKYSTTRDVEQYVVEYKYDNGVPAHRYGEREIAGTSELDKAQKAYNDNRAAIANLNKQLEQQAEEAAKLTFKVTGSATPPKTGGAGGSGKADLQKTAEEQKKAMIALTDSELKILRDRNRQVLQLELEKEQALINLEKDAAKRRTLQRELDSKKETIELQQQLEDQIEAEITRAKAIFEARERVAKAEAEKNGKTYQEKYFNSGNLRTADINANMTDEQIEALNTGDVGREQIKAIIAYYKMMGTISKEAQQQRIDKELKEQRLAMQEYLRDYGTMEEKKTAIAALFAEKRAQATSDAERIRLTREENQAYADLGFDDFVRNKAALAFGEIDNLSQKTIGDLILQLETYRDKALETFDPDKIEKYEQALAKLKRAQALNSGGILGQMFTPDFIKEQQAALQELKAAEQTHNDMLDKKAEKEQEVANKVQAIIDKVKELTGKELTADQVKDGATVGGEIDKLMLQGNAEGAGDLSDAMQNLDKARGELGAIEEASQRATNSFNQLKEAFTAKFTGANGALAGAMSIMNEIDALAQGAKEIFDDIAGTAELLGADMGEGSSWDTACQVMNAFAESTEAGKKIVESLISLNPVGVLTGVTQIFTSWINAFATIHDNAREKKIKTLQKEIDELQRINERIEHRLKKEYSKEASQDYEREIKNLEKQQQLIRQQIVAEQDKKKTDNDRIQEWKDEIEALGRQIDDYKDKVQDAIIGEDISASIDSFVDAMSEAWGKTTAGAKAAKDYVKAMLRQMVQEAMKTDLKGPIEDLRAMMAEALADDVVTQKEQEELEKFAQELNDKIQKKYSWADEILKDGTNSQSGATTGTFATASQDSITELSGRAAAIHTSGEMRRELLMNIWIDLAIIKAAAERGQQVNDEIRGLQLLAVGYLEDIAKNTRELYQMNERLEKIEKNTRNL